MSPEDKKLIEQMQDEIAPEVYEQMSGEYPSAKTVQPDGSQPPQRPKTMEEQEAELDWWINEGIYEAARHQMSAGQEGEPGPVG